MTAAPWYAIADLPQCQIPRLVAVWTGYVVEAAFMRHPKTRALTLFDRVQATSCGELVPLPSETMRRAGCGPLPDAWRPFDPATWRWPNGREPQPLPVLLRPRMWSSTMKFGAVDDAEAAELAAEMERDRADARDRSGGAAAGEGSAGGGAEPPEKQWWLTETHLIAYSPPGRISLRETEGRLGRAALTDQWIRVERPADRTFAQILGGMIKPEPLAPGDSFVPDLAPLRLVPSGRDQDDYLTACGWLRGLTGAGAKVLRDRLSAPAMTWKAIARRAGLKADAARAAYRFAIADACATANGGATEEVRAVWAERREQKREQEAARVARNERLTALGERKSRGGARA